MSPVASVIRAALVSVNLFNLLCNGSGVLDHGSLGTMNKFGGPIVYLIGLGVIYTLILVAVDLNYQLPFPTRKAWRTRSSENVASAPEDVLGEAACAELDTISPLRVLHVTKSFDRKLPPQVDDVTFTVARDTVLALLGPNGGGKTTTFNVIRGQVVQDAGEVHYTGHIGVCPQFTPLDANLTVREHLKVYGLLKGIPRGEILHSNVETMMQATTLSPYADRVASQLSGGNGRKLALAIALMGNPSVVLIDEFSTGIDPATKRSMWLTLQRVTAGKAVVITTRQ